VDRQSEEHPVAFKLHDDHLALLREVQWQGGVLFLDNDADQQIYQELVEAEYLHGEFASGGGHRYELTFQGVQRLQVRGVKARKKGPINYGPNKATLTCS
jgi:hypothetical protein